MDLQLDWDLGTAYDMFVSLEVLHHPDKYGLRGAWAAGVRARLPTDERETLEQSQDLFNIPFHWIHGLPQPKDGAAVLWSLGRIPAAERLATLMLSPRTPRQAARTLQEVAARQDWSEADRQVLRSVYVPWRKEKGLRAPNLVVLLDCWAQAEDFGRRYARALQAYHEAFFVEEEKRIRPALERALERAQALAQDLALPDLVEQLSQGLRFVELPQVAKVTLAPSYWGTPFVFMGEAGPKSDIWLFGARPEQDSLVPGEVVPDALLQTLKALSDPTRLRILRYLAEAPHTPAELARRLRLRAPTVSHHLTALRRAGLVHLMLGEDMDREAYTTRVEALTAAYNALKNFLYE
ncbi:MAG: winged helix-turn-helix transcriptional regulator [Chloroflexia bacterium]|nr:winged helix-turn-helix transcriptional regulator [Chloroflexia bacterium]